MGDVVGCLLDTANCQFRFYLNGIVQTYEPLNDKHSRPNCFINSAELAISFHPSVILEPHQQCYFNFGQEPWASSDHLDGLNYTTFYAEHSNNNDIENIELSNFNLNEEQINSLISDLEEGNIYLFELVTEESGLIDNDVNVNSPKTNENDCDDEGIFELDFLFIDHFNDILE